MLEEGSRWNWFDDATIRDCALIAGVAGILFVIRSLTFARPVVDLRALGNRNFTLGCVLSFITGIGIFSTIYLTPLFLGYVRGFSAWQTGIAIFSTGAASLLGVPVYILLARKFDTRWLMMFGLASFGAAMWSFSFITHDWGAAQLLLPQAFRGFPQVFAVAPSVNLGLGSLPPERLKYASGLFNMMRNLGGAVGIAVSGAILNDRTNFHFHAIASNLTPANGAMTRMIASASSRYAAVLGSAQEGHAAALAQLVAPRLSRGVDHGFCRRLSRHHDRLRHRHPFGSAHAQRRRPEGAGAGFALKPAARGQAAGRSRGAAARSRNRPWRADGLGSSFPRWFCSVHHLSADAGQSIGSHCGRGARRAAMAFSGFP